MIYLLFFILIVLEIACLIGLYLAYRKLDQWQAMLYDAQNALLATKAAFSHKMKIGRLTGRQVLNALGMAERFLPWWFKLLFGATRFLTKIKIQTG